ncbi:unnamed protein product [Closterium sp. Naga37s-1]|nr:unnamed protein product [Closterium sp. Naga37s-1]
MAVASVVSLPLLSHILLIHFLALPFFHLPPVPSLSQPLLSPPPSPSTSRRPVPPRTTSARGRARGDASGTCISPRADGASPRGSAAIAPTPRSVPRASGRHASPPSLKTAEESTTRLPAVAENGGRISSVTDTSPRSLPHLSTPSSSPQSYESYPQLGGSFPRTASEEYPQLGGLLSQDSAANPVFHAWNLVWVVYCDGGAYSSTRGRADLGEGASVYMQGRQILDDIITDLRTRQGMGAASHVLFSGSSAGGHAIIMHCDRLAAAFPRASSKCFADSGFFVDAKDRFGVYSWQEYIRLLTALHRIEVPKCPAETRQLGLLLPQTLGHHLFPSPLPPHFPRVSSLLCSPCSHPLRSTSEGQLGLLLPRTLGHLLPSPHPLLPSPHPLLPSPHPCSPLPTLAPLSPPLAPLSPPLAPLSPPLAPLSPPLAPLSPPLAPLSPPLAPLSPPLAPLSPPLAPLSPPLAPLIPLPLALLRSTTMTCGMEGRAAEDPSQQHRMTRAMSGGHLWGKMGRTPCQGGGGGSEQHDSLLTSPVGALEGKVQHTPWRIVERRS